MQRFSDQANYSSGPDNGTPTKTVPVIPYFQDGVNGAAQEMNYLLNQRDALLQLVLSNCAHNWKEQELAASYGGYSALTCASLIDFNGGQTYSKWLIGAGNASGSGNTSAFTTSGLNDGDIVDVALAPISGGLIKDVAFNATTAEYLAFYQAAAGDGAVYKCPVGGSWTAMISIGTAIVGRPRLRFVGTAIYAVYLTGGNLACAVSTNNGVTWGNGFGVASSATDVSVADNGSLVMVMTSDGAYKVGSLASWASFTNPFGGGEAPTGITWSRDMGAWFAATFDGTHARVYRSADNVGWTLVSTTLAFTPFSIAAAGHMLAMSDAPSTSNQVYFSPDEGKTWYVGMAPVATPGSPVIAPAVYGSSVGFCNIGQNSLRFSARCGLPAASQP